MRIESKLRNAEEAVEAMLGARRIMTAWLEDGLARYGGECMPPEELEARYPDATWLFLEWEQ